jgi:hypothetical protein
MGIRGERARTCGDTTYTSAAYAAVALPSSLVTVTVTRLYVKGSVRRVVAPPSLATEYVRHPVARASAASASHSRSASVAASSNAASDTSTEAAYTVAAATLSGAQGMKSRTGSTAPEPAWMGLGGWW